jgi:hypothetical protein
MGKLSDIKQKQAELLDIAGDRLNGYARVKSEQINNKMSNSHYSRPMLLLGILMVILTFFGLGVFLYKGNYYQMAPSESIHQPILAPAAEEEMEEELLRKIKKKALGGVSSPNALPDSSATK